MTLFTTISLLLAFTTQGFDAQGAFEPHTTTGFGMEDDTAVPCEVTPEMLHDDMLELRRHIVSTKCSLLSLESFGLTDEDMIGLCAVLMFEKGHEVQHLGLAYNSIGDFGTQMLLHLLQGDEKSIRAHSAIYDSGNEIIKPQTPAIYAIDLSHNFVTDIGVQHMCEVIRTHLVLSFLDMSYNHISDAGADLLAIALGDGMTQLILSGNHIGAQGLLALKEALSQGHVFAQLEADGLTGEFGDTSYDKLLTEIDLLNIMNLKMLTIYSSILLSVGMMDVTGEDLFDGFDGTVPSDVGDFSSKTSFMDSETGAAPSNLTPGARSGSMSRSRSVNEYEEVDPEELEELDVYSYEEMTVSLSAIKNKTKVADSL